MTEPNPADPTPGGPTRVLLLGTGDAGGELVRALEALGVTVAVGQCTDGPEKLTELTALLDEHTPDVVVATSDDVSTDVLIAASERDGVEVVPTPRAVRLSHDREGLRRLAADELGLPTVPFWFAGSAEELAAVAGHAGFPLAVSPAADDAATAATPTKGRSVLLRTEDVEPAWRAATDGSGPKRVLAETVVDVDDEVTLLTVRTTGQAGPAVHFCEPIGYRELPDGALEAWQPHAMPTSALDAARSVAARIVNSLGGRGLFAVDLFLRDDEVYFATVRVLPGDSGLVTLRSQRLSQFELHARAILGLPLDTIMISPAAAEVSAADGVPASHVLAEALATPETDVRFVGGKAVTLATAPDVVRARDRAHRVAAALSGAPS